MLDLIIFTWDLLFDVVIMFCLSTNLQLCIASHTFTSGDGDTVMAALPQNCDQTQTLLKGIDPTSEVYRNNQPFFEFCTHSHFQPRNQLIFGQVRPVSSAVIALFGKTPYFWQQRQLLESEALMIFDRFNHFDFEVLKNRQCIAASSLASTQVLNK